MKNCLFFLVIWFLFLSNIKFVFSSEYYQLKLLDESTHKPISNVIVLCDNKIISISDSLGCFQIQKQCHYNSYFFTIQSIQYHLKQIEFAYLDTEHENIIYLSGFQNISSEILSTVNTLEELVLQSIKNNISRHSPHYSFIANYSQFESYHINNKLHSNTMFDESITLKSNHQKNLTFSNKFPKNVNKSLFDVLTNHPIKYKDLNVTRKRDTYKYSANRIYYNSDIDSKIIEIIAYNGTGTNFSETVFFTIRMKDTTLIQFHSMFSPVSDESFRIHYPNKYIAYSFMQYNELYPIIISAHYTYYSRKRKNNFFEQNRHSTLIINKLENSYAENNN